MNVTAVLRQLAAGAVVGALVVPGLASAGTGVIEATTSGVTVAPGAVRIVVSADQMPPGRQLDPSDVRVRVGDIEWPAKGEALGTSTIDVAQTVVIAVDTSGSMGPGGIADAQAAARRFLEVAPAEVAIGLVTFASHAEVLVAPTVDRAAVLAALAEMRPGGNTRLYDGIEAALAALAGDGRRALVLLSDGRDTASTATLEQVGGALAQAGVQVDFVAFRTEQNQVQILNELAGRAGGRVSAAGNGTQLADVFAGAAENLVNEVVVSVEVPPGTPAMPAELVVEIGAGAGTAQARVKVEVPPTPGTAAATPGVVRQAVPWSHGLVAAVAFTAIFLLVLAGASPSTWGRANSRRLREVQRYSLEQRTTTVAAADLATGAVTQKALLLANRVVQRRGVEESWRLALDRAAVPLRPHEWLIVRVAAVVVAAAVAVLLLPWWVLTAPLFGVTTWFGTNVFLRFRGGRRLRRFEEQLPDMLQLVAGSLRSGFSFQQAVDNAARDGEDPIAGELSRALAESRLGVPIEDALERVAERMRSRDLTWTVMALRIAREVGGNMAEVLLSTAETIRERWRLQRHVRALSAEGRLSAYVLIGLPIALTLWMVAFRGSYVAPLVTDPLGWVMSTFGITSVAVGAWWMSRLVKTEV